MKEKHDEKFSIINNINEIYHKLQEEIINGESEKKYQSAIEKAINHIEEIKKKFSDNLYKNQIEKIIDGYNRESEIYNEQKIIYDQFFFIIKSSIETVNDNIYTIAIDYFSLRQKEYKQYLDKLYIKHPKDDPLSELLNKGSNINLEELPSYKEKASDTEELKKKFIFDNKFNRIHNSKFNEPSFSSEEEIEFIKFIQTTFLTCDKKPTNRLLGFCLRLLKLTNKQDWKKELLNLYIKVENQFGKLDLPPAEYITGLKNELSIFDILHASYYKNIPEKENNSKIEHQWDDIIYIYREVFEEVDTLKEDYCRSNKAMEQEMRRWCENNFFDDDLFPVELRNHRVFFNETELRNWFKRNKKHSKVENLWQKQKNIG